MSTKRRSRLIPKGGRECFEIRIACSLTRDGTVTMAEITTPTGDGYPSLIEMLGALEVAKLDLMSLYAEDSDDD